MRELEIVIVSHKRALSLKRTIESVMKALSKVQLTSHIRVLLNGVDEDSKVMLTALSSEPWFEFDQLNETLGPAAARNFLVEKAKTAANWVLFLDDDCVVTEDFFQKWRTVITGPAADADIIGGPNITFREASAFEKASGRVLASSFASMRSAWRYRETTAHFRCTDVELTSTHLFVRAHVLKEFSYPETFQTAEENAFLHGVRSKFNKIYYFGELFVYHERRPSFAAFTWQIFRYGRGRGQMVRDGYPFEWFHIAPAVFVAVVVGVLFWPADILIYFTRTVVAAYLVALVVASIMARTLWAPLLFFAVHAAYVSGWWWGFLFRSSPRTLKADA